jgi:hypothetical protein
VSPVSRLAARIGAASLILALAALGSAPFWAWGRPDRVAGLVVGAAASLARLAWAFHLARGLGDGADLAAGAAGGTARRYAAARLAGLIPLAGALALAGLVEGIDLGAACVGVFFATAASVLAAAASPDSRASGAGSGTNEARPAEGCEG